jgi:hypothetical protein
MARTAVGDATLASAGAVVNPTAGDGTNGHVYNWARNRVLLVHNGSVASINVTVDTPDTDTEDSLAVTVAQRVVAVAAGAITAIDTRHRAYRQSDGTVHVDLSAATTVKLGTLVVGEPA